MFSSAKCYAKWITRSLYLKSLFRKKSLKCLKIINNPKTENIVSIFIWVTLKLKINQSKGVKEMQYFYHSKHLKLKKKIKIKT